MKADLRRWEEQARALGPDTKNPLNIPYPVALEEAASAAGFIEKYWEPIDGVPGLMRTKKRLPLSIKEEILSLLATIQEVQTQYLMLVDPNVPRLGPRANELLNQLISVLSFVLDDGVDEPEDEQLDNIKEYHSQNSQRSTALAQSLKSFAALAESIKERIKQEDEGFDLSKIDEAKSLAESLNERVTTDASRSDQASALLLQRNQLLVLLVRRVNLVRSTASYVFEEHPKVLREVMSAYERQRRAKARLEAKLREQST